MNAPASKYVIRLPQVRILHRRGFSEDGIADEIGIGAEHVRMLLRKAGFKNQMRQTSTAWDKRLYSKWRLSKWERILPPDIAKKQAQWEVWQSVVRVRAAGTTFQEIGSWLGVSAERARQIECQAKRLRIAPIEAYFALFGQSVAHIVRHAQAPGRRS